ncbi:O-antigen polymerase [Sphingomonas sp.]|jgi:oligosaccharide repeat unit polymerase|uniref:O-antigen polymerase n=1 Tax=Sphingomonas sp. TaxID=28214 RepID=UPI002D7EDB62|nr:O-antigen polymerase [Sphingomonas sp.]HEU0043735.1 O-antigen polymerase [Sphingomonas sp.]
MIGPVLYEFLLLAGVLFWAAIVVWWSRHKLASIYHPLTHYLLFHGILFAIRPVLAHILQYDKLYPALGFQPTWGDKVTVLVAANLALAVFVIVSVRVGNLPMTRAGRTEGANPPRFNLAFWFMLIICLPPALASFISTFRSRDIGVSTMINNAETGATINTTGNGYFTDIGLMLGPIAVLIAWTGRFRWWSLLPLLVFIVARAGTGTRWPFVMAVFSAASLWAWEHRHRWPPKSLFVAAVPLIALFTVIGEDRGKFIRQLTSGQQAERVDTEYFSQRPLESMDYGNMEFFEYMVHTVPAKTGTYDYFLNNFQLFTEPVPRVLWPGKPQGAPFERLFIWRYGNSIGASMAIPGEGWRALGWIGVVLWTAAFAWFYGRVYNLFVASNQDWPKVALFMLFMPVALQCFRDGAIVTVAKTSFFPLIPVLIWWGLSRLRPDPQTAVMPKPALG